MDGCGDLRSRTSSCSGLACPPSMHGQTHGVQADRSVAIIEPLPSATRHPPPHAQFHLRHLSDRRRAGGKGRNCAALARVPLRLFAAGLPNLQAARPSRVGRRLRSRSGVRPGLWLLPGKSNRAVKRRACACGLGKLQRPDNPENPRMGEGPVRTGLSAATSLASRPQPSKLTSCC